MSLDLIWLELVIGWLRRALGLPCKGREFPFQQGAAEHEMPDEKNSPELYHYTSEAGFRGIVASNSLWATFFEDLNDSAAFAATDLVYLF